MTVTDYSYHRPQSLEQALSALGDHPRAAILASGTDLLLKLRYEEIAPEALVDISRLPGLRGLRADDGGLWIGPLTTMRELESSAEVRDKCAGLAEGAAEVGSIQIRNLATLGGNVCNASPAADTIPALLVADAQAEVVGPRGRRVLALDQFFLGPGRTRLEAGELLAGIRLPPPGGRRGVAYLRRCIRRQLDLAVVGVAAAVTLDGAGRIQAARLALGAVAPTPIRAREAEALVASAGTLDPATLAGAAQLARQASRPISDLRGTAPYRREMVGVLTRRALLEAFRRAQEKSHR